LEVDVNLGDLQQLTMLAVARLTADAYAAVIREELIRTAGRKVSVPTVYVTLVRLEEHGLVESTETPLSEGRGGRARRVFRLTPAGWEALNDARASMARMWDGVVQP
jgi:DNA-binding PadR family transcriptional regulator